MLFWFHYFGFQDPLLRLVLNKFHTVSVKIFNLNNYFINHVSFKCSHIYLLIYLLSGIFDAVITTAATTAKKS